MLVEKEHVLIKKGPKENRFRPSIDALFRSGAYIYGKRAIGVVLSGVLDDGTSGLWSVKRLGGITIVQQPNDARFESMPRSALEYVEVDHTLTAPEIGKVLGTLVNETARSSKMDDSQSEDQKRMGAEVGIAAENDALNKGVLELGELTPFTCPECHGVAGARSGRKNVPFPVSHGSRVYRQRADRGCHGIYGRTALAGDPKSGGRRTFARSHGETS